MTKKRFPQSTPLPSKDVLQSAAQHLGQLAGNLDRLARKLVSGIGTEPTRAKRTTATKTRASQPVPAKKRVSTTKNSPRQAKPGGKKGPGNPRGGAE